MKKKDLEVGTRTKRECGEDKWTTTGTRRENRRAARRVKEIGVCFKGFPL